MFTFNKIYCKMFFRIKLFKNSNQKKELMYEYWASKKKYCTATTK